MKKFLLLLSVFLSTLSLAAQNTASFSIQSKPIKAGETVELKVTMTNSKDTETSAFQFDLKIAEGLSFVMTDEISEDYFGLNKKEISTSYYSCSSSLQKDNTNTLRVVLYSSKNLSFTKTKLPDPLEIGYIKVKAASNFNGAAEVTMDGAIIAGSSTNDGNISADDAFKVVNSKGEVIDPKEPAAEAEVYIPATGLALDQTSLTVAAGSSATALVATPAPAGNYPVTWTSSDEKVATVDENGVVTGVSKGTATITATIIASDPDAAKSATCAVTVTAPAPTEVTLNKATATIKVGATETLTATLTPENADASNLTWTSSDQTVATVVDGVVTGVKAGTATITATAAEGVTASCEVTVENVYVESITLTPATISLNLKAGESQAFTPEFTPANATIQTLTWALSGEGATCAEVDNDGKVTIKDVTGEDVGKTITVTATSAEGAVAAGSEAVTATATITLAATPIEVITLKVEPAQIKDGETAVITATIEPATATYPTVNFTLNGTTVTKVEPAEGEDPVANQITVVAGATPGQTTIKATPSTPVTGDAEPMTIDVEVIATPVTGITLSTEPDANSMKGGATMTFTATVAPETATNKEVTWSVSDESLATITPEGVLTAKTGVTGTVTVTATSKSETNVTATKEIEIIGVVVTAITLAPTEKTLAQGDELTIVPTLTGETIDGVDVEPTNKTITWSAAWAEDATFEGTAPAVADFVTVEDGKVTIVKVSPETATKKVVITAKPNGATTDITATCTITLEKTTVTAVAVTAPKDTADKPALKQDETLQLTATVTPENATYQTVTWASSSTDVTVSETGLVTIVKVTEETANDEVTITATTTDPDVDATKGNGTFTITLAPTPVETVEADLTAVTLLPGTKVNGKVTKVDPENATIKTLEATSKADATATITLADDNTFTIIGVAKGNTTATIAATSGTENAKAEITVTVEEALTITTDARQNPETKDAQVAKMRQIKYTANTTLPVTWSIVNEEKTEEAATETPEAATEAILAEEPTEGEGDNSGEGEGDNSGEGEGTDTPATTDNEVAYIAETGFDAETGLAYCLVEGIAPGTATVTATIDPENIADGADETKLKAEDKIEVINVLADKITLSATKLTMSKGDTKELTATLTPEEGVEEAVSIQEVEWTVSNEKVLEVVEEGDLTISFKALANGTCTITATTVDSSDLTAECVITVAPTVTGIEAVGIDEAESSFIRVYDLSGKCVATSAEQYARLGEGLYIVKTAKRTIKVLKADITPAGL